MSTSAINAMRIVRALTPISVAVGLAALDVPAPATVIVLTQSMAVLSAATSSAVCRRMRFPLADKLAP